MKLVENSGISVDMALSTKRLRVLIVTVSYINVISNLEIRNVDYVAKIKCRSNVRNEYG